MGSVPVQWRKPRARRGPAVSRKAAAIGGAAVLALVAAACSSGSSAGGGGTSTSTSTNNNAAASSLSTNGDTATWAETPGFVPNFIFPRPPTAPGTSTTCRS
jgi:hypothetical protein